MYSGTSHYKARVGGASGYNGGAGGYTPSSQPRIGQTTGTSSGGYKSSLTNNRLSQQKSTTYERKNQEISDKIGHSSTMPRGSNNASYLQNSSMYS